MGLVRTMIGILAQNYHFDLERKKSLWHLATLSKDKTLTLYTVFNSGLVLKNTQRMCNLLYNSLLVSLFQYQYLYKQLWLQTRDAHISPISVLNFLTDHPDGQSGPPHFHSTQSEHWFRTGLSVYLTPMTAPHSPTTKTSLSNVLMTQEVLG